MNIQEQIKEILENKLILRELNPVRFDDLVTDLTNLLTKAQEEAVAGVIKYIRDSAKASCTTSRTISFLRDPWGSDLDWYGNEYLASLDKEKMNKGEQTPCDNARETLEEFQKTLLSDSRISGELYLVIDTLIDNFLKGKHE